MSQNAQDIDHVWSHAQEDIRSLKDQRIFLTGGTGFFGRSFLEMIIPLIEREKLGTQITVLSRDPDAFREKYPELCPDSIIRLHRGDVTEFEFPQGGHHETILHFATPADPALNLREPFKMYDIAVSGMRRVLEFARSSGCTRFLFTSSGAVYGRQPLDVSHQPESSLIAPDPTAVGSAYGEGKRVSEFMGCEAARTSGFAFKIARCYAFVGPHLDRRGAFAIGNFMGDLERGNTIEVQGDGTTLRSYLYSADLVIWLLRICNRGESLKPYNVGSDQSLSISTLAQTVVECIKPGATVTIKKPPTPGARPERYIPSIERARSELGLQVWIPLRDAIKRSARDYHLGRGH